MRKIYAICPDTNSRHGGIKKLYRHVDILNANGFDASIVHENIGFRCDWFENNTKVNYISQINFDDTDYLVIPEIYGPNLANTYKGVKKVIFNQNAYYSFQGYSLDKSDLTTAYTSEDVEAVIVVSEDSGQYLKYTFPDLKIFRLHYGIDSSIFKYNFNHNRKISLMLSKQPQDVAQVINILKFKGILNEYELEIIANKSELEVAHILNESSIFLWFCYQEGWGLPPGEAMASGSIAIGYHGMAGKEFIKPEFSYPIADGDVINFAQTIEEVVNTYKYNPEILESKAEKAANYVHKNHSLAKEEEDIVNIWNEILKENESQAKFTPQNHDSKISIVVPWWDHTELLNIWKNNLKYLSNYEIIFVDNGSQPQGKLELEEFCKQHEIQLIRNQENRGFSAANNQGLKVATGEYILYLNNDVEILKFPAKLFCKLAANGISGPGFIENEIGENYLEGWSLCIKKSTLETLGGWCEDYGPGYWDDVDLCLRARLAGYSLTPIPNIQTFMRHKQNTTGRDGRLDQIALHLRNRGIFLQKHYSIHPKIVIDGVFFQLYETGIARVWKSLLEEWSDNYFAKHIIVLDRAGTAPRIPDIRYRQIPEYNYSDTDTDREMLQQICDEEDADLFISSYYTTPLITPSVFMAHDMIPELMGWDLNHPMWQEKHYGIQQASAYIAVSENTAKDLVKCFPDINPSAITVAHLGVSNTFKPGLPQEISGFQTKYGITKPYFLLVGPSTGYKNSTLFFEAFVKLASRNGFDIICTASGGVLVPEWRSYTYGSTVHMLQLSDSELAIAYSGAIALVYPSKYEGFGLPILEAMACGCPVITCANASIPEVAGEAAIYIKDNDTEGLANALCEVQKPGIRQLLIDRGIEQAKKFTWSSTAKTVSSVLIDATIVALNLRELNLIIFPDWTQPEEILAEELEKVIGTLATHADSQYMTLLIDVSNSDGDYAEMLLSAVSMNLLMQDLDISEGLEISLLSQLGEMQWEALLPRIKARICLECENKEQLITVKVENLNVSELYSFH